MDSVRVESGEIRELVRAAARSTNVRMKLPSADYVVLLYVPPHQVLAPLVGSFRLIAITSCAGRSAYFVPELAIRSIRTPSRGSISQVYLVWLELVRRYAKSGLTTSLIVRCQSSDFWPGHCNWWLPVGLLQDVAVFCYNLIEHLVRNRIIILFEDWSYFIKHSPGISSTESGIFCDEFYRTDNEFCTWSDHRCRTRLLV